MAEDVKTNWLGLWKNREGLYSGRIIVKKDIPTHSRLILRYNRYWDKDSNRPRFVYCFASGDASKMMTEEISKSEYKNLMGLADMYCFSYEQLSRLINTVAADVGGDGEYGEHLVEDYCSGHGFETVVL